MFGLSYSKRHQTERLLEWLRDHHPTDVPMVCDVGKKCPRFRHTNGAWDWEDLYSHLRGPAYDIGILLDKLCVVDVDDKQLAEGLETQFPILKDVACEQTTKGRHYFFVRSVKAEREGFYDGRSQKVIGIDLKTVCTNGTRSFLVVAPSTGKKWIRKPWRHHPLIEIPDELLVHVGVPKFPVTPIPKTLVLSDGTRVSTDHHAGVISRCKVFSLFDDGSGECPLKDVSCDEMSEFLFACKSGVTRRFPDAAFVTGMIGLADFLDADRTCVKQAFAAGGYCHRMLDLFAYCPQMALALHEEALVRCGHSGVSGSLSRVTTETYHSIAKSVVVNRTSNWLFLGSGREVSDEEVPMHRLAQADELHRRLPCFAKAFMQQFPEELVLAGGAALSTVCPGVPMGESDYDFFVCSENHERAESIAKILTGGHPVVWRSPNAVTMKIGHFKVQMILRRYESRVHLLTSFDLQPCKVLIRYGGVEVDGFVAEATTSWFVSMCTSSIYVDTSMWGTSSTYRALKYACRGFLLCVPCARRSLVRQDSPVGQGGVGRLFEVERFVRGVFPTEEELRRMRSELKSWDCQRSDYDTYKKFMGGVRHWWSWLAGQRFAATQDAVRMSLATWTSNHRPRDPKWYIFHDKVAWVMGYAGSLTGMKEGEAAEATTVSEYLKYLHCFSEDRASS